VYDLIVIGGGPAGLTAALYGLRKRLDVLLISQDLGGKINYQMEVAWADTDSVIRGNEIVERIWSDLDQIEHDRRLERVTDVSWEDKRDCFVVATEAGVEQLGRAVVLATGARLKQLGITGEREYLGLGLSYSAISYAPLFADREVAVLGDSDRALRAAAELAQVATRVHFVTEAEVSDANPLANKLANSLKTVVWTGCRPIAIEGDKYVTGLRIEDNRGQGSLLPVEGVFVELPVEPNSESVARLVQCNEVGQVMVDNRNRTDRPGLFAAGDVTDVSTEQVLIAVGEGAKAALSAFEFILEQLDHG
jgi:alkyl hydroperoxide reductase subunit F